MVVIDTLPPLHRLAWTGPLQLLSPGCALCVRGRGLSFLRFLGRVGW